MPIAKSDQLFQLIKSLDKAEKRNFKLYARRLDSNKNPFFIQVFDWEFVDYGEDTGPIIGQAAFPIAATESIDAVRKKGLSLEWQLYPKCIQYIAEGRLRVVEKVFKLKNGRQYNRKIVEILPKSGER